MDMKSLTRKWHGLPVWAWAAIVAVMLFLLYRYFQGRNAGSSASASPTAAQDAGTTAAGSPSAGGSAGLPTPEDNTIPYDYYGGLSDPYFTGPMFGEAPQNSYDLPDVSRLSPAIQSSQGIDYGSPIYPANTFSSLAPLGGSPSYKISSADILKPGQRPLFTPGITIGQPQEPVYSTLPNLTPLVASPRNIKSLPTDVNRATQTDVAQAAKVRQIGV